MKNIRIVWALSLLCCVGSALGQGIELRDYRHLVTLSAVEFSPDSSRVAFIKSVPDFKNDKAVTTLMVVNMAGGELRALTDGSQSISLPRWSPKGDRIGFIVQDDKQLGHLFVVSAHGGAPREITHAPNGIQQFAWSPDGSSIAYVTPDNDPNAVAIAHHDGLFDIGDDGYLITHVSVPSHIWIAPAKGGAGRRLIHGSWSVLENVAPFIGAISDPSWSADGRSIVFDRQATPNQSDSDQSQIAQADVATGEVTRLSDATTYEYQPQSSGVSEEVAYLRPHGPTPLSVMDVYSTDSEGHNLDLTPELDRDVTAFSWIPGHQDLVLFGPEGPKSRLWVRHAGGAATPIDLGELSPSEFSVAKSGAIAMVASTATTPPEIYVVKSPSSKPNVLTDFNHTLRKLQYGPVKEIKWSSPDGEACEGLLTYPVGYTAGRKYPIVMFNHGGPEASALAQYNGFEAEFIRQPLATHGYFVFEPNYRGSDNLGNHHEHAIYRDPVVGPASDAMSGLAYVESLGCIDTMRVSVAGHSYGGCMTGWLIGHDHRWRSAVVADGALDWKDTYNLTAVGNMAFSRDSLGGTPWDPQSADLYRTGSPDTYAGDVTTPTLLISGTSDDVVPITESFTLYHALREHHIPVRFVGVPGAKHTPDDPVQYEHFVALIIDWLLKHDS